MYKSKSGKYFSMALFILGMMGLSALAGTINTLDVPFSDNFESYTNRTPLIDGTNGWYASSNSVIVQTNIVYRGTNAAMIPPDCELSNRFVQVDGSNIWVSMMIQPCLIDASWVAADSLLPTNSTAGFYINSNGYYVVYNGTSGWTELTTMYDGSAAPRVASNQWSRFDLRMDHGNRTWALFSDSQLLRTNIAFVNSDNFSFSGFDIQNIGLDPTNYEATPGYLDNVSVSYTPPSNFPDQTNSWQPVLAISVTNVSRIIWGGQSASSNSFQVWKSSGYLPLLFTNLITYATSCGTCTDWLSVAQANGTSHGEPSTVWLVLTNTASLPVSTQAYNATVQIDGTDKFFGISASNSPQYITVSLYVLDAPKLSVTPLYLTNSVTIGHRAAGQYFYVANTSTPPRFSMDYTVSSGTSWITNNPVSGSVIDETNLIALTYPTEALGLGWHTGVVTVIATGTQDVHVAMRVNSLPVLSNSWNAGQNNITEGETLPATNFYVWNSSAWPTGTMQFTVSSDSDWLSLSPASGTSSGDRQAITITYANVSSLLPGEYLGTITLVGQDVSTGDAASKSPTNLVVRLTVRGRATLVTDTTTLSGSVMENCVSTSPAAFNIWNGAGAPHGGLNYTVSPSVSWLTVSPSSGTVTNDHKAITVIWTPGGLAPGNHTGSIIVDGTDALTGGRAQGAPQTISVQMNVISRSPVNYEKPSIYGPPYIGQKLTARKGLWQNMDRLTFAYQWQRADNAAGTALVNISGEIASNYVVAVADRGKYMRIAVTATDANPIPRSTTAYSVLVPSAKIKAVTGDFGGDGVTDLWFFDPSTGMWRVSFAADIFAEGQFGSAGMMAVTGDYDGDGYLDLGVYDRDHGMWHLLLLPSGVYFSGSMFGGIYEETIATPVPADYDGDGATDVALYVRGYWAILYSSLGRIVLVPPIAGEDAAPVPADYDGDGIDDLAVYDSGLWTIQDVWGEQWSVSFGSAAWIPVPGDYDGDNITDIGIFSQSANVWNMIYSSSGVTHSRSFGTSRGANLPLQGYYDHDAYCDPATLNYSANGDFFVWCVTRSFYDHVPYKGTNSQTYQKSINEWRVSW